MTFLNPAILFGLIAASIPIVLHFLNLRKLKKIEFSTLIFLKELQKTKIRRIKLKQWLLLLLRVLIILFLVFAFARPTIKNVSFGSSTAKTTAVFIIDNTFSMSVVSKDGSYFNKAKQIANSLINNFRPGDEIAVVPLAAASNTDTSPKTNFNIVQRDIDNLQLSYISSTINDALTKAGQILYESKNFNKEIYLLTDLQSGRIFNSKSELSDMDGLLKGSKIFLLDLQNKDAVNLGISEFKLSNQIFEKNKTVNFNSVVTNYSDIPIGNSIASLFVNGKRSAQQSISVAARESVPLNFETTLNDTGLIQASVELEDDDINYDNKRYIDFYVPDKIKILILTERPDDSKFIDLALGITGSNSFSLTHLSLTMISSIDLSKYDACVIIGAENINGSDKLNRFIESGGGILFMPARTTGTPSLNNFFNSLGIKLSSTFVGEQNSQETAVKFDKVNFQNPIFADLFRDKTKAKVESPDIYCYDRIIPGINGTTIISMYDNSAFFSEFKKGNGKILVFNSAPDLSWNNFPLKSLFAPLINKSVLYLASKTTSEQSLIAGNEITASVRLISNNQVRVERPDNSIDYINTDSLTNKNYLTYKNTSLTGTYKFYSGNVLLDYFAVNFDTKESIAKYSTVDDLENYLNDIGYSNKPVELNPEGDISTAVLQSRFGSELWQYFLIAALLLALVEMFVSKSSKKDLAPE